MKEIINNELALPESIYNILRQTIKDKNEEYSIYLHSPFCVKACKYCVYTGKLINDINYKDYYSSYINEYLPKAINNYKDIFNIKPAKFFYFGGGTPNLFTAQDVKKTLSLIPNFNKIKQKIADINPAYLNIKTLNAFIEMGFTCLCFGIQSFDKETLCKNNRDAIDLEKLKKYIDICHDNNVYTSIDLMCYLNHYNADDIGILEKDLEISKELNLDFIAVNPNMHFIFKDRNYGLLFEKFMDSYITYSYNGYISEKDIIKGTKLNNRYIYRIVAQKNKDIFYDKILGYYADDFPYADNNIIGIGDLNNPHNTMSYVHNKLYYTEKNINNIPVYNIKYISQEQNNLNSLKEVIKQWKN